MSGSRNKLATLDRRQEFSFATSIWFAPFARVVCLVVLVAAGSGQAVAQDVQIAQASITDRVLGIFGAGERPAASPGVPPAPPTTLSQEDQRCIARPTPACVTDFLTRAMAGVGEMDLRAVAAGMLVPLLVEQRQTDRLRDLAREFRATPSGLHAAAGLVLVAVRSGNEAAVEAAVGDFRGSASVASAVRGFPPKVLFKGVESPFPGEYFIWAAAKGRTSEALSLAMSLRGQQVQRMGEYASHLFAAGKQDEARLIMENLARAEIEGRQRRGSQTAAQTPRVYPWSAMFESSQSEVTLDSILADWTSFDPNADSFNIYGARQGLEAGRFAGLSPSDRSAWLYNGVSRVFANSFSVRANAARAATPAENAEALNRVVSEFARALVAAGDLDAAGRVLGWGIQESGASLSSALSQAGAALARAHLARSDVRAYAQLADRFPQLISAVEPDLLGELVAARDVDRALQVARNVRNALDRVRRLLDVSHALFLAGDARRGAAVRDEARIALAGLTVDMDRYYGQAIEGSLIAIETEPAAALLRLADKGDLDELVWRGRLNALEAGIRRLSERKDTARLADLLRVSANAFSTAQGSRQDWLARAVMLSAAALVRNGQAGPSFRELDRVANPDHRWKLSLFAIGALADVSFVIE